MIRPDRGVSLSAAFQVLDCHSRHQPIKIVFVALNAQAEIDRLGDGKMHCHAWRIRCYNLPRRSRFSDASLSINQTFYNGPLPLPHFEHFIFTLIRPSWRWSSC